MTTDEVPLAGGNVNSGVVRIGDTVRRSLTAASPAVHKLLRHLEDKGFTGSPRFLGIDAQGREVLSYLEGETGIPMYIWRSDQPLIAAARLLRAYHDAVADFDFHDEPWAYRYADAAQHEVVCHNDFGAYNLVYRGEVPVGIIDFDLAGPGPRLRDVAYAAYWMAPLSFGNAGQRAFAEADLRMHSRRLRLFCDTYGVTCDAALLDMVEHVLWHMGDETQAAGMIGPQAAAALKADGHLDYWQREGAAFKEIRPQILVGGKP